MKIIFLPTTSTQHLSQCSLGSGLKNVPGVDIDCNEVLNDCRQHLEIKPLPHLLLAEQKSYCTSGAEIVKDLLEFHLAAG